MTSLRTRAAAAAALLIALAAPAGAQRGPAPAPTGLPPEVLAMACAPRPAFDVPDMALRITGGQDSFARRTYAPGDLISINAGTDHGMEPGQQFFVRRLQVEANQRPSRMTPGSVRTAGWIKVYAVDKQLSLATIVHACDTIDADDYLEPFVMPVMPKATATDAKPQRDNYARIMFGADYRRSFARGDFFLIDRGADLGVEPGDRFVVYRNTKQPDAFLYVLGEAVAVEVNGDTSTLQVTLARDAFTEGDYVAIRK